MEQKGKKILLIDDDSDFRLATRKILESGGYEVVEAKSGQEGFDLAKSTSPDLVLIDIIMESFTEGFNLIQKLYEDEKTKDIPRIILSTLGIQQDLDSIYPKELDTKFILQKPVKKEELLKMVGSILD